MEIDCYLPLPLSFAVTLKIPFASISNVTSIWGTPLGAEGIPVSYTHLTLPTSDLV